MEVKIGDWVDGIGGLSPPPANQKMEAVAFWHCTADEPSQALPDQCVKGLESAVKNSNLDITLLTYQNLSNVPACIVVQKPALSEAIFQERLGMYKVLLESLTLRLTRLTLRLTLIRVNPAIWSLTLSGYILVSLP